MESNLGFFNLQGKNKKYLFVCLKVFVKIKKFRKNSVGLEIQGGFFRLFTKSGVSSNLGIKIFPRVQIQKMLVGSVQIEWRTQFHFEKNSAEKGRKLNLAKNVLVC